MDVKPLHEQAKLESVCSGRRQEAYRDNRDVHELKIKICFGKQDCSLPKILANGMSSSHKRDLIPG